MPPDSAVVLIVERDQNVRELQAHFLGLAGFLPEFVEDGAAALAKATAAPPALVVTEILIPRLDGLTLCRRLREDPATRNVPVVVFSILAAGARAREAGASAFIRKPLVEATFIETVRHAIAAPVPTYMEQQQ